MTTNQASPTAAPPRDWEVRAETSRKRSQERASNRKANTARLSAEFAEARRNETPDDEAERRERKREKDAQRRKKRREEQRETPSPQQAMRAGAGEESEPETSAQEPWEDLVRRVSVMGVHGSLHMCRIKVSEYGIQTNAHWRHVRNTAKSQLYRCIHPGCRCEVTIERVDDYKWRILDYEHHSNHRDRPWRPRPLSEHLLSVLLDREAAGHKGAVLHKEVEDMLGCQVAKSTVAWNAQQHGIKDDWLTQWRKLKDMVRRLGDLGGWVGHIDPSTGQMDENTIRFIYVEAPYCKQFIGSRAYLRVNFVDACHVNDHTRGVLLSICTVTADSIILPLACALGNSENNDSYEFLFRHFRGAIADMRELGFVTDQNPAISHGIREVLGDLEPKHSECLYHLLKGAKGKQYLRDLVMADHPLLFAARKIQLQEGAPSTYERFAEVIERIAFMGSTSNAAYTFEYVASSPAESLNSALSSARDGEFLNLFKCWLEWGLGQVQKQLEMVPPDMTDLCSAARNEVTRSIEQSDSMRVVEGNQYYTVYSVIEGHVALPYTVTIVAGVMKSTLACCCGHWERVGIPCVHIYAVYGAFPNRHELPATRACHRAVTIRRALTPANQIPWKLINFNALSPDPNIKIPPVNPRVGRPKKGRHKSGAELFERRPLRRCSKCGALCKHNARTCKGTKKGHRTNKKKKKTTRARPLVAVLHELMSTGQ